MKRWIALTLTAITVCLTACTGNSSPNAANTPSAASNSAAPSTEQATQAATESASAEVPRPDGLPAYTGGPAEIRFGWWGDDNRAQLTQQVIDKFMAAYPEIKVTGEPNGGTPDHFAIIDTQLAGHNAPDIIQFGGNYPDYLSYMQPLSQYKGNLLQIDTPEKFDQGPLETGSKNGSLYAVSVGTNTLVLMYNKDLLARVNAPAPSDSMTWDEFVAYGEQIKPLLHAENAFPYADNSVSTANYISYFFTQNGEPLWTAEEKSYATVEGVKKWIDLWEDMRDKGIIPDIDTASSYAERSADTSSLVAGKTAFALTWSNQVAGFQAAMTDTLALCPLPLGKDPAQQIQVSQFLGVNKESKNIDAAVLFINFFVSSPESGSILGTNRGVPSSPIVRAAIADSATPLDGQIYTYYNLISQQGRTVPQGPNLPNDQEFVDELLRIGQSVAFKTIDRQQGAQQIYDLIQRLMVK